MQGSVALKLNTNRRRKVETKIAVYFAPLLLILNNLQLNGVGQFFEIAVLICSFVVAVYLNFSVTKASNNLHIAILAIGFATISVFINGSGFGSLVAFANLLLYLVFFSKVCLDDKEKRLFTTLILISILLILVIFSKQSTNKYYYSVLPSLTKERLNPNVVAIYLFFAYVFLSLSMDGMKRRKDAVTLKVALFIVVFLMVLKTESRTILVAFLLYACGDAYAPKRREFAYCEGRPISNKAQSKTTAFATCLLATLLFTVVYCGLANVFGSSLKIFGKGLFSGRQSVWAEAFEIIKDNLIFGYNNSYVFSHGDLQFLSVHNSLLALLFIFGIVPTALAIYLLTDSFRSIVRARAKKSIRVAIYCCLFIMTFETLITDSNLYLYFTFLFMLGGASSDTSKDSLLLVRRKALK